MINIYRWLESIQNEVNLLTKKANKNVTDLDDNKRFIDIFCQIRAFLSKFVIIAIAVCNNMYLL